MILASLRATLLSGVSSMRPPPDRSELGSAFSAATSAARSAHSEAFSSTSSVADSGADHAAAATYSSAFSATRSAAHSVSHSAAAPALAADSALSAAYADTTLQIPNMFHAQLWPNPTEIGHLLRYLEEFRIHASKHAEWAFWAEWYQGFVDGKPLDWELQRRVAVIDDAIWEQGPEAVAAAIDKVKAEMLSEKLPMAEIIEVNPDTGKFRAVPIPIQNQPHMSALLNQVEDALEDCLGGHNGLRETAGDVRKLNRALGKYREDPQNAELTLSTVAGSLRRQIHESRELPDNEDNLALLSTVEDAVRGIRAEHPDVEENRLKRASLAVQELPEEDKALLRDALPVLEELSDDPLGEDFSEDFEEMLSPRLHNDAVGPVPDLPECAKPLMGEYRAFSRISKFALLMEKGAKIFDSKEIKSARLAHLGYTVTQLFTQLVQIGWRLFEVLL